MPVYKYDNGWMFRTSIDGRQYKRKGFKTKKEATESEAKFRANYTNHEAETYKRVTFDDAVNYYLAEAEKRFKISTITTYTLWINKHMRDFFKDKDLQRINRDDINKWREYMDKGDYVVDYKNKMLRILRAIFKYSNVHFKTSNLILELEPPFRSDAPVIDKNSIYTIDEFNRFTAVIDNLMFKAFFTLLFFTGMRISEIRGLTWNDIDLDEHTVRVNKTAITKVPSKYKTNGYLLQVPKTKSSIRTIDYHKDFVNDVLIQYRDSISNRLGFNKKWLVFGDVTPLSETNIRRYSIKYSKLANLHTIRIHDFRHSYITMLHDLGVDVSITKEQAGHSSINTTVNIYTHISKKQRKDSINTAFDKLKK